MNIIKLNYLHIVWYISLSILFACFIVLAMKVSEKNVLAKNDLSCLLNGTCSKNYIATNKDELNYKDFIKIIHTSESISSYSKIWGKDENIYFEYSQKDNLKWILVLKNNKGYFEVDTFIGKENYESVLQCLQNN